MQTTVTAPPRTEKHGTDNGEFSDGNQGGGDTQLKLVGWLAVLGLTAL